MYQLPKLPYDYNSLEPYIDGRTMEIHHSKHHAGYVKNLNTALEGQADLEAKELEEVLANIDALPSQIQKAVRNNGGGHANHSLFWQVMSPNGGGEPAGELAESVNNVFGSFESFKESFTAEAAGRFGSGAVVLGLRGGMTGSGESSGKRQAGAK